ncbi:MAG: hypothetical protein JSR41_02965 [Proteobacteria bacterium]|nr:hypothetical protein [Pseudomonadota bacterium]
MNLLPKAQRHQQDKEKVRRRHPPEHGGMKAYALGQQLRTGRHHHTLPQRLHVPQR